MTRHYFGTLIFMLIFIVFILHAIKREHVKYSIIGCLDTPRHSLADNLFSNICLENFCVIEEKIFIYFLFSPIFSLFPIVWRLLLIDKVFIFYRFLVHFFFFCIEASLWEGLKTPPNPCPPIPPPPLSSYRGQKRILMNISL